MKIGLVGYGYWGKIIESNLSEYSDLTIYDPAHPRYKKTNVSKMFEHCSHIFVATPATTHYDIVDEALSSGCNVFCEKPLVITSEEAKALYQKAAASGVSLYVDWVFTCNPIIRKIRSLMDSRITGRLVQASMNRMNLGPARSDVTARYDLTSHDLSILCYLVGEELEVEHKDFPVEQVENSKSHTCYTGVKWKGGKAQINTSWNYPAKNRSCTFTFERATVHWDDFHGFAYINGQPLRATEVRQPLQVSIDEFLSSTYDVENNRRLTLQVQSLLESGGD